MIKKLIILGNHIQALGLARMADAIGLEVTLMNDYRASITRFSNACHHFILFKDEQDLLKKLIHRENEKDTLLVATNDGLISFISDNYNSLAAKYNLSIPQPDVVDVCLNKKLTYQKARTLDIPIPESYFPDSIDEIQDLAAKINYPVILKPAVMHTFYKKTGKKVFFCNNEYDLVQNYEKLLELIPPDEVIVQQFLDGGPKKLYSFASFTAGGIVYAGFVTNRLRQKPMDFGISTCYAKTVISREIESLASKFLTSINYFGLAEVEFMYDEVAKNYKLLEINPRTWKWHSIANKLGINWIKMLARSFNGDPLDTKIVREDGVAWVERLTDAYILCNEVIKKKMAVKDYLHSFANLNIESAVWSVKDPLPAIVYILLSPYLILKRN